MQFGIRKHLKFYSLYCYRAIVNITLSLYYLSFEGNTFQETAEQETDLKIILILFLSWGIQVSYQCKYQ